MKRISKCRLCFEIKELSFEHIPPASAFNSIPVYFQKHIHLHEKVSYLYGKKVRSNRGAGGFYLCESCNKKTGSWYAADYAEFAKLGMYVMTNRVYANNFICAEYPIKPLNVLKQILMMFVALESSGHLQPTLQKFLMEPENMNMPENFRVFAYFTNEIRLRNPLSFSNMDGYMRKFGEISFKPFGFHIAVDSPPIQRPYCEITKFSEFNFNQPANIILPLQFLVPKLYFPGIYL